MPGTPANLGHCPNCRSNMSLRRVAASPSLDYEAHTFDCANCRFRYTARFETPIGIRAWRLEQGSSIGPVRRQRLRTISPIV